MLGMEFLKGQGLGNQLFCLASVKSLALDNGYLFGTANQKIFAQNIHNNRGMYFMDVDLGENIDDPADFNRYDEKEERIWIKNSYHDVTHGCYIAGADPDLFQIRDNTIVYGNLQSERYFEKHIGDFKKWFRVKKACESYEYSADDLCIMNMRGGEYVGARELYLRKQYWLNAMEYMKKINSNMRFMIVTEDVKNAKKMFHDIPVYHFDMGGDYVTVKNAKYLIVSNSSFACFPVFTSETCKVVIAPKYWARHNVSTGYWASEQNIYSGWLYMDRDGRVFTDKECKAELDNYKKTDAFKKLRSAKKPEGIDYFVQANLLRIKGYLGVQ